MDRTCARPQLSAHPISLNSRSLNFPIYQNMGFGVGWAKGGRLCPRPIINQEVQRPLLEKPGTPRKRHRLRNLFLAVMALAALVLWQLGPVTHGVASIETGLHQAQGTRSLLAGFIHIAITQIKATLGPLVQQIFH